jgi:MFS family permease
MSTPWCTHIGLSRKVTNEPYNDYLLNDFIRRRTLLALTISSFIITLICGFSVNSEMFIACRLLQGKKKKKEVYWR